MPVPVLVTKLFIPPARPEFVPRPHLVEMLTQGLHHKLTLISAPAGFGKTTLVSEWIDAAGHLTAWLSLDQSDNDFTRFLTYIIAALNQVDVDKNISGKVPFGKGTLSMLQSPQPLPLETVLTPLINEIAAIPEEIILVLDDYHLIDAQTVHNALSFLIEHLPEQIHLVIATREDPPIPLARHRARGQLTELRAADLRFTSAEAAEFLNQVMELGLSKENIDALENRTEGWIAGLQLAAISIRGHDDATSRIESFTGSHRLVLDYLIEDVLDQQPEPIQHFLIQTSVLDQLTGSLCNALTGQEEGQATLERLERANLFIVPLDDERRWYRYHHLFADLLRKRLDRTQPQETPSLHQRASQWFEENGYELEAFSHAAAANDIARAERLVEAGGMPLHFRGAMTPVLAWLEKLPRAVMDTRPSLWVLYASALTFIGHPVEQVEEILQAAEAAIARTTGEAGAGTNDKNRDLLGQTAALRAMLAVPQYRLNTILEQSRRALELLNPENLPVRTAATWTLGLAYQRRGDRAAASQAYTDTISISQASGNIMFTIAAATSQGQIQEAENELHLAAESYHQARETSGEPPMPAAAEACLGLARIHYQWNDLATAENFGLLSLRLARQMHNIDTPALCQALLARVKLAQGNTPGAAALLQEAIDFMHLHNHVDRLPEIAALQALLLLRQGDLAAAADLVERHDLPLGMARAALAQGDSGAALSTLHSLRQAGDKGSQTKDSPAERLHILLLQALANHAHNQTAQAMDLLSEALALAEPGGHIRIFVDEGPLMAHLLYEARSRQIAPDYTSRLLAAFTVDEPGGPKPARSHSLVDDEWVEPLSQREIEVLRLIAQGLTNQEVANRLYLSLNTVKVHTRNINAKLSVNSRTKAVARARALGILPAD